MNGVGRRDVLKKAGTFGAAMTWGGNIGRGQTQPAKNTLPNFYRFGVGSFECVLLADGMARPNGPHPIFGVDQTPDAVNRFAEEHFLPTNRVDLTFAPLLVSKGPETVLFDAGWGDVGGPTLGKLLSNLQAAGYDPTRVTKLVITHGHRDHVGGVSTGGALTFPNAEILIPDPELSFWASTTIPEALAAHAKVFAERVAPFKSRIKTYKPGEAVAPGIRSELAAGHTPGHCIFRIEDGGDALLHLVDIAHNQFFSFEKPMWQLAFDIDRGQAARTRQIVLDMAASERVRVVGYHLPFPCLGHVARHDQAFRFVPETYQL